MYGTPGQIRTDNQQILSLPALPISVQGHIGREPNYPLAGLAGLSRIVKFNRPLLVIRFCHRAAHSARLGGTQNYRLSLNWYLLLDSNLQPPASKASRTTN